MAAANAGQAHPKPTANQPRDTRRHRGVGADTRRWQVPGTSAQHFIADDPNFVDSRLTGRAGGDGGGVFGHTGRVGPGATFSKA